MKDSENMASVSHRVRVFLGPKDVESPWEIISWHVC